LDDKEYIVPTYGYIPTIIDFGFSSVNLEGKQIGTKGYEEYGILTTMVPGYDMFKFLLFALDNAQSYPIYDSIIQLLKFYGRREPYRILTVGHDGVRQALNEFCALGTYSEISKYTPKMFADWIQDTYTTPIERLERKIYIPLNFTPLNEAYYSLLKDEDYGKLQDRELISQCMKGTLSSYVFTLYNKYLLLQYKSVYPEQIEELDLILASNKSVLMQQDKLVFEKYTSIPLLTERELNLSISSVLTYNIPLRQSYREIKKTLEVYKSVLQFRKQVTYYLEMMYMILEMKLEETEPVYQELLTEFKRSPQYLLWKKSINRINQSARWSETLAQLL
jgi:predicted transcriptional regulator